MNQNSKTDLSEIEKFLPVLRLYNNDNQETLRKIKKCLFGFSSCYETQSGRELSLSSKDNIRNFSPLLENQRRYIDILQSSKNKYVEVSDQNIHLFENIETLIEQGDKNV